MKIHHNALCLLLTALLQLSAPPAAAQTPAIGRCGFAVDSLQFAGTPTTQAACLLRPVKPWGVVDAAPATLPPVLASLVGEPVTDDLRVRLQTLATLPSDVGGNLQMALSHGRGGAAGAPQARYFVIHDTSSPWLADAPNFPPDDAPALNALQPFAGPNAVAHVFVNRLGQTLLGHDFSEPWRATKFETQTIGAPAKGLFLHIELLQPRRRDPAGGAKNDAIAPTPGFTAAQYQKLALLYTAASARSGQWLIPAFHAALDEGMSDAHDDPQHFELSAFAAALQALHQRLDGGPLAAPAATKPAVADAPSCAAIWALLPQLRPAEQLVASNSPGHKTWKELYDDCDANDRFAGQPLPSHGGRSLRCSTDRNRLESMSRYADGTLVFTAKMSVDADGSPVIGGSGWPNDVQTWLTFDAGSAQQFVNAEEVPFIVVPLAVANTGMSLQRDSGIKKGDLAVMLKGQRCSFGLVGDAGPWFRIGEGSLKAHADLGNPQCQTAGEHPCKKLRGGSGVGIASGVTYLVFPGTRPKPLLSQTAVKVIEPLAAAKALSFLQANKTP